MDVERWTSWPSFCKMQFDNFDTIQYLNDQFLNWNQVLGFATSLHDSFKMMRWMVNVILKNLNRVFLQI